MSQGTSRSGPPYALIVGHGRSGTTWLLELLDLSPQTFCRNEPDLAARSPFQELWHDGRVCRRSPAALDGGWDQAVRWTVARMGHTDLPAKVAKDYPSPLSRSRGLSRLVPGKTLRRYARAAVLSLRGEEWALPGSVRDQRGFEQALPIIKFVQAPGWAAFVLRHRADVPVFHIARHPGGFLNSWSKRYLREADPAAVRESNRQRLEDVAREYPHWAERFGDPAAMSTDESELWYWRYATEAIHDAGQGNPLYRLINYEALAADPVPVLRDCFAACGLNWTGAIESAVAAAPAESIAHGWRKAVGDDRLAIIDRVLSDSPLAAWWPQETAPQAGETAAPSLMTAR